MLPFSPLIACAILISRSTAFPTHSKSQVLLPKPTGLYQVGRSAVELIDYNRTQPFIDDVEPIRLISRCIIRLSTSTIPSQAHICFQRLHSLRIILLSGAGLAAPNGTFEKVALQLASQLPTQNLTNQSACEFPLVVFMPGEGTTRLFYGQIGSTNASTGYIVVAIDVPYDVDIVQYPDESFAFVNPSLWTESSPDIEAVKAVAYLGIATRAGDVSFVLDFLSNTTLVHELIPNLPPSGLNTTHTAMFGHSLGGTTAFSILESDDRIFGGMNMDGDLLVHLCQMDLPNPSCSWGVRTTLEIVANWIRTYLGPMDGTISLAGKETSQ